MRRYLFPEKHISFLEKRQKMERFNMNRKTVQLGIYLRYKFNNRRAFFYRSIGFTTQISLSSLSDYITWKEAFFEAFPWIWSSRSKKSSERGDSNGL